MSKVRRTCAVAILTAALATSALAGIMDSPGVASPPPPPPGETNTPPSSMTTTVILTILSLIR